MRVNCGSLKLAVGSRHEERGEINREREIRARFSASRCKMWNYGRPAWVRAAALHSRQPVVRRTQDGQTDSAGKSAAGRRPATKLMTNSTRTVDPSHA